MSERKEVNLKEILFAEVEKYRQDFPKENMYSNEEMENSSEFKYFINAMKEACRQVLELASENANMECSKYKGTWTVTEKSIDDYTDIVVNKQSILNTINQVKS